MTVSVTELAHKSSLGSGANWQSPTFNTVSGGEIWVAIQGGNATAFGIASNDGGWTFSSLLSMGPISANYRLQIFKATNTSSQTGRTITVSSAAGDGYDVCILQVEGTFQELQKCLYTGAGGEPLTIGTLSVAATTGNFCLLFLGMNEDSGGHGAVSISGWTAESVNSWANANFFYGINAFSKSDFTGTSVSVTEYAVSPTWGMGAIIELTEDMTPLAPTIRGWATATNSTDVLPAVSLNLPTRVAGDLLLAFAAEDSATALTHSQTTTWTELSDEAGTGANRLGVYARIATNDANDALSIAGANAADGSFNMVAIANHGVTNVATDIKTAAAATGASGNADPPSVDPGSSKNWLSLAVACVDLTATGSSISAAPTNYTTDAILQKSAASTSSVALGVGPRRLSATQTENPGAFTNTSGAWIAKTLMVPPTAASVPQGSASGSISWAGSSTGTRSPKGSSSGAISWAGSSTGVTVRRGSNTGAITWSGVVVGGNLGVVIGSIAWVGSATGQTPLDVFDGSANGAISWAGSSTGVRSPKGSATGAIGWSGVVVGGNLGVVIGSIAWVGSATGKSSHKAASSGSVTWIGSSTGVTVHRGSSSGSVTWAGSATGEAPPDLFGGSANGDISWVGSSTGVRLPKASSVGSIVWAGIVVGADLGVAIGSISWVGSAIGTRVSKASTSGSISWVGSVDGQAPLLVSDGSANGDIFWIGSVSGSRLPKGNAAGIITWSGVVVGGNLGVAIGSIAWIGNASGMRSPQGSVAGSITWVGIATSPVVVDPLVFLLAAHVIGYKPKIVIGHLPQIVVGHKQTIMKGRDGG